MFDWLDQLRKKPEHVRFRVALTSAGVITGVIFLVWLSVISLQLTDSSEVTVEKASRESSPISAVGAFFGDAKRIIDESFGELGTIEYEAEE